jgi:hypothetical protein
MTIGFPKLVEIGKNILDKPDNSNTNKDLAAEIAARIGNTVWEVNTETG